MAKDPASRARSPADLTLKISLAGDSGVGKTSLVRRFVSNTFDESYLATLGTKVSSRVFDVEDPQAPWKKVHVGAAVWDIMGNHEFRGLLKEAFFNNANGVLLVCDVSAPESFYNLPQWYEIVASVAGSVPLVVLANKSDVRGAHNLPNEEIDRLCRELRWPWMSTSAKTGENVEAAFRRVATEHLTMARKPAGAAVA